MPVRNSLLAILAAHPAHGYGLKSSFEQTTARAWPLNVGQVYSTLARLERDGLVEPEGTSDGSRQTWRITAAGREALGEWYAEPVVNDPPSRDELAIKVLLAVAAEEVDVGVILHRQRVATMERLQELARHKRKADPVGELPWLLLLDALILKGEAELKWLDLCEERLRHRANADPEPEPEKETGA
ncbi:MAG: PadR family transcriptional regulator [bacterium]|nr:PadR family transcriptional regulator [bacterium]